MKPMLSVISVIMLFVSLPTMASICNNTAAKFKWNDAGDKIFDQYLCQNQNGKTRICLTKGFKNHIGGDVLSIVGNRDLGESYDGGNNLIITTSSISYIGYLSGEQETEGPFARYQTVKASENNSFLELSAKINHVVFGQNHDTKITFRLNTETGIAGYTEEIRGISTLFNMFEKWSPSVYENLNCVKIPESDLLVPNTYSNI